MRVFSPLSVNPDMQSLFIILRNINGQVADQQRADNWHTILVSSVRHGGHGEVDYAPQSVNCQRNVFL